MDRAGYPMCVIYATVWRRLLFGVTITEERASNPGHMNTGASTETRREPQEGGGEEEKASLLRASDGDTTNKTYKGTEDSPEHAAITVPASGSDR